MKTKTIKIYSILMLVGAVNFVSCSKVSEEVDHTPLVNYDVHESTDEDKKSIQEFLSVEGESGKLSALQDYNLERVHEIQPREHREISVLSVEPRDADLVEKKSLNFYRDEKEDIKFALETEVRSISSNVKDFEYKDLNGNTLYTLRFDNNQQRMIYIDANGNEFLEAPKDWGDDTAACFFDVYTNHGFLSVWVTVQTGFLPQTAVAFAAYCAWINYGTATE